MWVRYLGWEDPLEEGMASHSSILAWRIPWTEGLAGYSPWGCKESDTSAATQHACTYGVKVNGKNQTGQKQSSQIKEFCNYLLIHVLKQSYELNYQ